MATDFLYVDADSVVYLKPNTDRAKARIRKGDLVEVRQWFGAAIILPHEEALTARFLLRRAGYTVEGPCAYCLSLLHTTEQHAS